MQSHFSKTISNFKLTFSFITLLNDIDSTTELSNQSTMDGHQISDIDFRVLVGIHNQSSAVPEPRMNVSLPILTEQDVQTEFESVSATADPDRGTYEQTGMLPAYLFPGPTRIIQRKNRAIESIASKLGKVGSEMYSTNQEIDDHIVVCCRCDTALEPTVLNEIHKLLKCHEEKCQGRNYCRTCFTIYSGPFGQRGSSRAVHEKGCLPECDFQSMLTWLSDPIHRSVTSVDKYGFRYSGYNTERCGFSAADCVAMSQYLDNFFNRTHNSPRYQRLFAVLNSNLKFHKKTPPQWLQKNKSVLTAFFFEVLTTLPLDLPPYAPDASRENGTKKDPSDVTLPQWVNIPQRILSFI